MPRVTLPGESENGQPREVEGVDEKKFKRIVMTQRIRQLYKESGLNQTDFGAKVGLSQVCISRFLVGFRPSLPALFKIAVECEVSMDWMMGLADHRKE